MQNMGPTEEIGWNATRLTWVASPVLRANFPERLVKAVLIIGVGIKQLDMDNVVLPYILCYFIQTSSAWRLSDHSDNKRPPR